MSRVEWMGEWVEGEKKVNRSSGWGSGMRKRVCGRIGWLGE